MNGWKRPMTALPAELLNYSITTEGSSLFGSIPDHTLKNSPRLVIVSTCSAAGMLMENVEPEMHGTHHSMPAHSTSSSTHARARLFATPVRPFDYVFIDEASQAR